MAINYVKFSRRTPAQYAAAAHDSDTLYFVIEQDENTGLLYLGDKLIAGSAEGSDAARIKLDDLTDVIINTAELKDKSILVYDKHTNNWINSELNGFIFRGATSLSSGGVGLVPAPLAGQENYYLKGDCTWGKIPDTVDSSNVIGLDKLLNEKANIDDVQKINKSIDNLNNKVSNQDDSIDKINQSVNDLKELINGTNVDEELSSLNNRLSNIEDWKVQDDVGGYQYDINSLNEKIGSEKTQTDSATGLYSYIDNEIEKINSILNKQLGTINSMTFKSTIDKWSDLPIEGVKIGDTYAVSGSDTIIENDVFYYPGDLLIATGKETDGIITEGLVWEHIKTGYTGVYESRLVGEDNKITLKNYGDDSLGDIDFQTDGNISVSVSKNTVSIGLEKISYDIDDNTIIIE